MVQGSPSAIFFRVPLAGDGPPLHVPLNNTAALKVRRSASIQLPHPPIGCCVPDRPRRRVDRIIPFVGSTLLHPLGSVRCTELPLLKPLISMPGMRVGVNRIDRKPEQTIWNAIVRQG